MQCNADALVAAVNFLDVVPNAKTPSSDFFRLTAKMGKAKLSIAALLSGMAEFEAETPAPVEAYLNRKALKAFIGKGLGDGKIKLKADKEGGFVLKSGRREATFSSPSPAPGGYGETVPKKEAELTLTDNLIDELRLAGKYTVEDPATPELNSVRMTKDNMILSTNRVSAFYSESEIDGTGQLPAVFAPLLTAAGTLHLSSEGVRYVTETGYLFQPGVATQNKFPADKLLTMFEEAGKWKTRVTLDRTEFLAVLDRLGRLDGDEKSVFIEREKGEPFIYFRAVSASARFKEKIDYAGPDFEISEEMLIAPMLPFLQASSHGKISIKWNTGTAYCLTVSGSPRLLVTPRRRR